MALRDHRKLLYRIAFLVLLVGGLVYWMKARSPAQLSVEVNLEEALPGELSGVDITVRQGGRALARLDRSYRIGAAPQKVVIEVRGKPGPAEVDATLVYPGKPARRTRGNVELREGAAARMVAR